MEDGVGGWMQAQSADVCPPHCSGPAAGPHMQLQQAPLPHLLTLRSGSRAHVRRGAAARGAVEKGQNVWENRFALRQGRLVAALTVAEACFCPML